VTPAGENDLGRRNDTLAGLDDLDERVVDVARTTD
jgi:hypothetical protein